ncbi:type II secretion system F family protein [Natronosporangium hydrolyticum]|uniref:Type II secretion system F family protein n=2 Tax=Natronosporangium hydrolyticum TaxID=2811111 RepID=A0A895YDT5_9ACTN|nr:type II secretion system F family protein [Natronosporangium hydrolyticum]QSB15731.1 type II secretion system F family protein [Natronosporangium hydrolyticum]
MTGVQLLAAISGGLLVAGLIVFVRAFATPRHRPTGPPPWLAKVATRLWRGGGRNPEEQRRYQIGVAAAVLAGSVTWLVSGLPVLGLVVAAAVPGVPWLLAGGRAERRAIARVEAIAEWTRRLRDVAGTGAGLQAALMSAASTAPPAIEEQAGALAARLQAGWNGRQALLAFADEIDDSVCDQIVAALLLHLRDRGDRLGTVLGAIAGATAKEVAMRKEADAERSSARLSIRFMVGFTILVVVVAAFSGEYMAPYATAGGQILMALLAGVFVLLLIWVRMMTRPARLPRLLGPPNPEVTR